MTDQEWEALADYVRFVANALYLSDWNFTLTHDPPDDEDFYAVITPITGRKRATIAFCSDFKKLTPEQQRHTVVHELIHCHHAPADDVIRLDAGHQLSPATHEAIYGDYKRQVEYCVDGLADAFSKYMPLIEWPNPDQKSENEGPEPEPLKPPV